MIKNNLIKQFFVPERAWSVKDVRRAYAWKCRDTDSFGWGFTGL